MSASIIPFAPPRPYYRVELLGTACETGLPFYTVDLMVADEDGGGACRMWSGSTLESALDELQAASLADGIDLRRSPVRSSLTKNPPTAP